LASQQAGNDFGLPTSVTGDPVTQQDGTTVTPVQTFWYDRSGNLGCYGEAAGTWTLTYDMLSRPTSVADPDDSSANAGSICGKTGGQAGWNTQVTTSYNPDGSVASRRSPAERAVGVATSFSYDLDGSPVSETHHHNCTTASSCTAGTTLSYYDGAARLVEVQAPYDAANDFHPYPWLVRYFYDISGAGTHTLRRTEQFNVANTSTTAPFAAYGNLFAVQEYLDLGWSAPLDSDNSPRWVDHTGTSYDAVDRPVQTYDLSQAASPLSTTAYDGPSSVGLVASRTNAAGERASMTYDSVERVARVDFDGGSTSTPSRSYQYDASGRTSSVTTSAGVQAYTYDDAGHLLTDQEPATTGGTILTYAYTANGLRKSLTATGIVSQKLFDYVYRSDGLLAKQTAYRGSASGSFTWSYTDGGRLQQRTDPTTGLTIRGLRPFTGANATTFQPTRISYDSFGRRLLTTYPDGASSRSLSYDVEGNLLTPDAPDFVQNQGTGQYTYGLKGELVLTRINGGVSTGAFPANGAMPNNCPRRMAQPCYARPSSSSGQSTSFDMLSGRIVGTADNVSASTSFTYDAVGRRSGSQFQGTSTSGRATITSSGTTTQTFDAEDHITSYAASWTTTDADTGNSSQASRSDSIVWGAMGHPVSFAGTMTSYQPVSSSPNPATTSLRWDGPSLLYSNVGSSVDAIKVGSFADVLSNGHFVVYERASDGHIIESHSDDMSAPNSVGNGNDEAGPYACGPGEDLPCVKPVEWTPDSVTIVDATIQGARQVDSGNQTWTSRDAFAGYIGDPMSMKPYMFERNNSLSYSDPSGYCPAVRTDTGLQVIGCVTAKPVPPEQQLMPDGRTVGETVRSQREFTGALAEAMTWVTPGGAEAKGAVLGIALFKAAGIQFESHFAKRLGQRILQNRLTEADAMKALTNGVPYFDPKYGTYVFRDAASGVALTGNSLDRSATVLRSVFQGNNPSPRWIQLPWTGP
jgi:YD repeat-containing protein